METPYIIEDSAIEAFIGLLEQDYAYLELYEELELIEGMYPLMDSLFEDYKESEEYDPELAFLVGKHLEELGKHFKKLAEPDAKITLKMADDDYNPYGNSVTVGKRNNWSYEGDERLEQLNDDYEAIKSSRTSRRKKLRKKGKATKNPSYYLSVSKD